MAEMLAVPAHAAALLHPVVLRQLERCFADHIRKCRQPTTPQGAWVYGDTGMDQGVLAVVDGKHLAGESPEMIDRSLRAGMALVGAVAEPDHPLRGMPQVIGALLLRLRGNRSERRIARGHHGAPVEIGEGGIEELPHQRLAKV